MKALLIDFESTGVETATDRIIEIGAMVVDEAWQPIVKMSQLVRGEGTPPLTADIQRITKIPQEVYDKESVSLAQGALMLESMSAVDYVVAFNRSFDENIFKAEMVRHALSMLPGINHLIQTPWLCAMADIESNYAFKSWKLSHLALEYGVPVNPAELHRALADVELMRKMLAATGTTAYKMYEFQQTPWAFVQALIPAPWTDGGVGKNQAVKAGYGWETAKGTDGPKFEKSWVKRIKASKVEDEIKSVPFKIREIKVG